MRSDLHHGCARPDTNLVDLFLALPKKIVRHHEVDGLVQMVLHEFAHDEHLGLKRATYLIDSPEFDSLKGVAGFHRNECARHQQDLWLKPALFAHDMRDAQFHRSVEQLRHSSLCKKQDLASVKSFGEQIGIEQPSVFIFDLKHGNNGILIYEHTDRPPLAEEKGWLSAVGALLGLCHA